MFLCIGAMSGAPWLSWYNGSHHGSSCVIDRHVCCVPVASITAKNKTHQTTYQNCTNSYSMPMMEINLHVLGACFQLPHYFIVWIPYPTPIKNEFLISHYFHLHSLFSSLIEAQQFCPNASATPPPKKDGCLLLSSHFVNWIHIVVDLL